MAFPKTLIPCLSLFLLLINKVVSQEKITSFSYDSFDTCPKNGLLFQGDATVPPFSSIVRFTKVNCSGQLGRNSIGRLVYAEPVSFWDEGLQASFISTMQFEVTAGSEPAPGVGDGFNFFIIPVNSTIPQGSVDGNLGLFNPSTGEASQVFAVEFDIAPNWWDPSYQHLGIDIDSRVSKSVSRFESSVGQVVTAEIRYVSWTRTITVVARYGETTSTLSYVFDLKTVLPKQVHVGISATTGSWIAFHDLHAWSFSSALMWDEAANDIRRYVRSA